MRYLIIIILSFILLLSSCTRKATTYTNKETVRIDTFFRYREVIKTLPQKDSIIIYNPCDSLGIMNKFYAQISIPNGKVKIQSKNNNLIATVVSNQTVSVNDSTNRNQVSKDATIVEKVTVKNVIPSWIIVVLFIETLIILLYLYFKIIYLK
jgi:hypothetical protein